MADLIVEVTLMFQAPPDLDPGELLDVLDAIFEHSTVRDALTAGLYGSHLGELVTYDGFGMPEVAL